MIVTGITLLAIAGTVFAVSLQSSPTRIAQFHYEFTVPDSWEQIGSNTQFRETDVRPAGDTGTAKIIVQETELNYDATTERDHAVDQLRRHYERERAKKTPPAFDGFNADTSFAGRNVVYYIERVSAETAVDWYVLFQGKYQVSVGCQHGGGAEADYVKAACTRVVHSLTIH
jgi:type VII secretion-associated protein (TIGR03931 family)